jgi:hypothetical protein
LEFNLGFGGHGGRGSAIGAWVKVRRGRPRFW